MSTLPGLEPIASAAGFSPLDMLRVRGRRIAIRGAAGIVLAVMAVAGMDHMTVSSQRPAECAKTAIAAATPRPHIWPLSALPVTGTAGPALRDVMAEQRPDLALTAVVKANAGLVSGPMGHLPRVSGGVACITLPATNTAQQSAQVLVLTSPEAIRKARKVQAAAVKKATKGSGKWRRLPYSGLFEAAGKRYGVNPALLSAQAWRESGYNPTAKSPVGAQGISQFMPGTAKAWGLRDPYDPVQAIDAQARLMAHLIKKYSSAHLALAAYNAGEGAVDRYRTVPPYKETQRYVATINAKWQQIGD